VNAGTSHRFSLQRVTQLGLFVVLVVLIVGPLAVLRGASSRLLPQGARDGMSSCKRKTPRLSVAEGSLTQTKEMHISVRDNRSMTQTKGGRKHVSSGH